MSYSFHLSINVLFSMKYYFSCQPHFRRRFFEAPEFTWSVEYSTFGDGFHYFFYTLKKVNYGHFP